MSFYSPISLPLLTPTSLLSTYISPSTNTILSTPPVSLPVLGSEPLQHIAIKILTKRRIIMKRANDMKIKSIIDFYQQSPGAIEIPLIQLFGKLIGLPIKNNSNVRPGIV